MQNLRRLGGGAGILAGLAAAWHLLGVAVITPSMHLSMSAMDNPHKYLVWAHRHQDMISWINLPGSILAPLLGLVLLVAIADRLREHAPDWSQIGFALGTVGLIGLVVGAAVKQFGLGSLIQFHVTNKTGAAIAFYAVNGTANAFLNLGGLALGLGVLAIASAMLKMNGSYGMIGSFSIMTGLAQILSGLTPDRTVYLIASVLTAAWFAGTGAALWMETATGTLRKGRVREPREDISMVVGRGAEAR